MNKKSFYLALSVFVILVLALTFIYSYQINKRYEALQHQVVKTKVDPKSLPEPYLTKYTNKAILLEYGLSKNANKPIAKMTEEEINNDFRSWYRLGMVRKMLNDYQGAAEAWTKAGELAPTNSAPFANLADLYTYFLKDYNKAEQAYLQALNIFPTVDNYRLFADFYRISAPNNQNRVEDVILQGLKVFPNNEDLLAYIASYFREIGQKDKAIFYYEQLLKINPNHPNAQADLGKLKNSH